MKIGAPKPYFSDEDITFIIEKFKEILQGKSFLTQYKYCEELEKEFAKYIGTKYAVTTSSGTCSMEIILRTLGLRGCEIIVPTNTFAATAFAVIHSGNTPVFVDCGKDLTADPANVEEKITDRTKAVFTVHIGGLVSPNTEKIKRICEENNLYFIEDAAHAHGSSFNGKKAGTFGIANSFSFFSTKVMATGEGGMITTDDEKIYNLSKELRDQAKILKGPYQNYHERIGYNWRMLEVSALLGLVQLRKLDDFIKRRNEIAKIYNETLDGVIGLEILKVPKECVHNFYKYIIFLEKLDRIKLQEIMKKEYDISMGGYVYEIPLHQQPAFKEFVNGSLPVAEDLCSRHISVPLHHTMKDEEAIYVAESLKKALTI